MITIPDLIPYAERYARMEMEPLRITLYPRTNAHLVSYDPVLLDNLLARCVLDAATQGERLLNGDDGYDLPAPLRCLWRDERGYPLWAATPFMPVGDYERDVVYQHKRVQSGRWTAARGKNGYGVPTVSGRWMERRAPLPTIVCAEFVATCIGNAIEIGRLLEQLTHVGKRRAIGFGEIDHWLIEPLGHDFLLVDEIARLTRSLPAAAFEALLPRCYEPLEAPVPVGWTPPQWKPELFTLGWMAGAEMRIEWYEAAPT